MQYYDHILAGMFLSLSGSVLLGILTSLPVNFAVGGGALASIGFMYHGMFKNAPVNLSRATDR